MTEKQASVNKYLLGAVVGGVIGAVSALLFAPKSGKELRGDIKNQAQAIGERSASIAGEVSSKTQAAVQSVSTRASDLIGKAKSAAGSLAAGKQEAAAGGAESEEEAPTSGNVQ